MKSIALILYEWQAVSNYGELYRLFNTLHMLTTEEHQNWPFLPHRDWNAQVTVGVVYSLQNASNSESVLIQWSCHEQLFNSTNDISDMWGTFMGPSLANLQSFVQLPLFTTTYV